MPIVGFVPTKARLVLEESRDTVLVMRVIVAKGENILLTSGGTLQALAGVLRIRERKMELPSDDLEVGAMIYVSGSEKDKERSSAKFQLNISMPAKKFASLLGVALSGRLPTKFFVDSGAQAPHFGKRGLGYKMGTQGRTKVWDNKAYRSLPLVGFSVILPIVIRHSAEDPETEQGDPAPASTGQVSELAEAIDAFHAETKHSLMFVLTLVVVTAIILILFVLNIAWK